MIVLETLLQDARYGIRMLYRNAGFTAVTVFALALGIGLNTTVFTAYKAMIARPLDARDSGEMVNVAVMRDSGAADFNFSYPDYEAYRDSIHSFAGLIAFSPERARLSNTEFANVFAVSENYFKVLGVAALRGRTFDSISQSELTASPSVLVSENYWQRRFAGDPALLGKTVRLNDAAFTVGWNHTARFHRYQYGRARLLDSAQPGPGIACRRNLAARS
jgi:MacB-like periplasmic core domain